jgi:spectinomycin phosphotransferase
VRVYSEPQDLDRAVLADALRRHWSITAERLDYVPIGFGSHHWEAIGADGSRWFVTADNLESRAGRLPNDVLVALNRAFATAVALRDQAALEFVLAPITSAQGATLERIGPRYTMHVEPFIDGTAGEDGEFQHPDERLEVATLVGRVHAASAVLPNGLARREDFALSGRAELEAALTAPDLPWGPGPFAEQARELLRGNADGVRKRLCTYDRVAARILADPVGWVVTHGEPHSANVVRDAAGGLLLVDWDTALIGPPERDLWMVLDADMTGWDEYHAVTHADRPNEEILSLYEERWALAEICEYATLFRQSHNESADTRAALEEFGHYLA